MKNLLRIITLTAIVALACAITGCSNGSSSDNNSGNGGNTIIGSSYRGTMIQGNQTRYVICTFTDGTNWTLQRYTNNEYTTPASGSSNTKNGTYTISGTTIILTFEGTPYTGSTSNNWATIVLPAPFGTFTRQ